MKLSYHSSMHFIESSMAIIVLLTLNFIFLSSLQILTEFISMIFFILIFYFIYCFNAISGKLEWIQIFQIWSYGLMIFPLLNKQHVQDSESPASILYLIILDKDVRNSLLSFAAIYASPSSASAALQAKQLSEHAFRPSLVLADISAHNIALSAKSNSL